jgi:RND family efflux transporter MFP subunit
MTVVAPPPNPPPGGPPGGGFGGGAPTVIAAPVEVRPIGDRLTAIGDAAALRSVMLVPQVSGPLAQVAVAPGSYIEEGSVVARIENSAEIIALDRAQLVLSDAQATVTRLSALAGAATEVQRRNAELDLRTAELNLRSAELELSRRIIVAPISGWVGLIGVSVGDQVGPSTQLMRIDDRSEVVIQFRIPERFAARLRPGDSVAALPLALPEVTLTGTVRALDSRVDEASRTLRVEATVPNDDDRLRPGMAFRIEMAFAGEMQTAVDPLAIQWGSGGAFVWAVREGQATRVPVRILQRDEDAVLVAADLEAGEMVVTEGVQSLRPGAEVTIRATNGDAPETPTPAAFRGDGTRPRGG